MRRPVLVFRCRQPPGSSRHADDRIGTTAATLYDPAMIRHGSPPYLECSSKGDVRLSAFSARLRSHGGRSIEEVYQAAKIFEDGATDLTWKEAKGRRAVNMVEVRALYGRLWDAYIAENPHLLDVIREAAGLSDIFGQAGNACQATELWRIRNEVSHPSAAARSASRPPVRAASFCGVRPMPSRPVMQP